jgi:hypothetical protein
MTKHQETILARCRVEMSSALDAIDAAVDNAVTQAVRLRAAHDGINNDFNPVRAIRVAREAVAEYLRTTADEQGA